MFGIDIAFPRISFLQFWVTIAAGIAITVIYSIYLGIFVWFFGKPMRKYLTARLRPNSGIIQEYDREKLNLNMAEVREGQFIDIETQREIITEPKKHWWQRNKTKIIPNKPITAKSVISINGVKTLMVWNVNPTLPQNYLHALQKLIELGYSTVSDIIEDINSGLIKSDEVISTNPVELTYADFIDLHNEMANKYTINITADDVLGFSKKYLDHHPRKSIIEKEVTLEQKRLVDDKYKKWAFILIFVMIVLGFISAIYKIHTGGK